MARSWSNTGIRSIATSHLKDALQNVKTLTRALVGLAASLLVFALSAEQVPWLERSLDRLKGATNDVYLPLDEEVRAAFTANAPASYLQSQLRFAVDDLGLSFSGEFRFLELPFRFQRPDFTSDTLEQCRYLLGDSGEEIYLPTIDSLNDALYPALDDLKKNGLQEIKGVFITLPTGGQADRLQAILIFDAAGSQRVSQPVVVRRQPLSRITGQEGMLRRFFEFDANAARLAGYRGDRFLLFPDLEKVWEDTSYLTVAEAIEFLDEMKSRGTQEVEIGGIAVTERLVSLVAPSAVLLFVLFLLSHTAHLRSSIGTDLQLARAFPWIGLYPGWFPSVLVFASVTLLPIAAQVALIVLTWESSGPVMWLALTAAALTIAASIKLCLEIRSLRRMIYLAPIKEKRTKKFHA